MVIQVQAYGSPTPTFQWYRDSQLITNATAATLVVTNAQLPDTGTYSVTVSNPWGSPTAAAFVKVYVPTDLRPLTLTAPAIISSQTATPVSLLTMNCASI